MAMRCLSTRELNALRAALGKRRVSVDDVATFDYGRLIRVHGLGRKSIANIRAWLAEQGRCLRNDNDADDSMREAYEEMRTLERAIACLHAHGYTVMPPQMESSNSQLPKR